jgi:hypothetical protein
MGKIEDLVSERAQEALAGTYLAAFEAGGRACEHVLTSSPDRDQGGTYISGFGAGLGLVNVTSALLEYGSPQNRDPTSCQSSAPARQFTAGFLLKDPAGPAYAAVSIGVSGRLPQSDHDPA